MKPIKIEEEKAKKNNPLVPPLQMKILFKLAKPRASIAWIAT